MKQKIQFLLMTITLVFGGCGSDRNNTNDKDSLLTDTSIIDTTNIQAAPADTVVSEDSISQNTGLVTH